MNDFCVYNSVICIEFIPSTQTFGKVKKKKQKKAATIKSEELSNKVTFWIDRINSVTPKISSSTCVNQFNSLTTLMRDLPT